MTPGVEIKTVLTEVSVEDVAEAFVEACWRVNMRPTHDLIIMLLAHSGLETGHWKIMRCYNFGNVKATGGWIAGGGDFCYYEASENLQPKQSLALLVNAKVRTDGGSYKDNPLDTVKRGERKDGRWSMWFYPSHMQCRFRAFDSLSDGATAYIHKLLGRYASALAWAQAGNVERYVEELHDFGYFTAGLAGYKRLLRILFKRYWKTSVAVDDPAEREEHSHDMADAVAYAIKNAAALVGGGSDDT